MGLGMSDAPTRVRATYEWESGSPPSLRDCTHPWDRIDVCNNGDVLACCFAQEPLGNVLRDGLEAVLQGERRRMLQTDVSAGRLHPTCFNAPCIYAPSALKRDWRVWFPPDRFRLHGRDGGGAILCAGDGESLFVEGPWRFLPIGRMTLTVRFRQLGGWRARIKGGRIRVELVDDSGRCYLRNTSRRRWGRNFDISLSFGLPSLLRRRMAVRVVAGQFGAPIEFLGLAIQKCRE